MAELTVAIGDKTYPFKKLNIAIIEEHLEFLKRNSRRKQGEAIDPGEGLDGMIEMTQIIYQCIRRAKPDVSLAELKEQIEQDDLGAVFEQVMRGGGMAPPGEKTPAVA